MKSLLAALIAAGLSGLFLAAVADGAGLPIPGGVDALIIYLASFRHHSPMLLASIAVAGSTLGNLVLFFLARRGGEVYMQKRVRSKRAVRFQQWFHHYGLLTVFISALIPLPIMPMKIFVLCAGAFQSPPLAFLLTFVGARIPRYLALALLGSEMGNSALEYLRIHAWHLTSAAAGLFAFLYLLVKWTDHRRQQRTTGSAHLR